MTNESDFLCVFVIVRYFILFLFLLSLLYLFLSFLSKIAGGNYTYTQLFRGINHHLFKKEHFSFTLVSSIQVYQCTTYCEQKEKLLILEDTEFYLHQKNVSLVKPKVMADGNGDQGTVPKVF